MREFWLVYVRFYIVYNKIYKVNGFDEKFCLRKYKIEYICNYYIILLKILFFLMSLI